MSGRIVNYSHIASALQTPEAAEQVSAASIQAAADRATMQEAEAAADQAALGSALARLADAEIDPEVFTAVNDRKASLLQSFMAEESVKQGYAKVSATQEVTFDSHDIYGWAKSFFTWWRKIEPAIWLKSPDEPEPLPVNARIGILGDWGTGLYGAPVCASSIENDSKPFDVLIHLGDVYYSGTVDEVKNRFLALWPKKNVKLSRALNSNHEMYTGGNAYFQLTLRKFNQPASYFAMQNDKWLLIGLDSGYEDADLAYNQSEFVHKLVSAAGSRRVVLMTHHQLFSIGESQGEKLAMKLGDLLMRGKIFAWYWGHEHRCVLYDRHTQMKLYGRCIGHSGYPYFRETFGGTAVKTVTNAQWLRVTSHAPVPSGLLLDGPNAYVTTHPNKYGPNGYICIELLDNGIAETVYAADGTVLLQQTIQ